MLLVDPAQGPMDALEFLALVQEKFPSVSILVYSMVDERRLASRCMQAGVMGYVNKTESIARLLMAVRQVAAGGVAYSAGLIQKMIAGNGLRQAGGRRSGPGQMLSRRQFEIFEMIGRGMDSQAIADKLNLSPRTVDVHRANIRNSLGLGSANEVLRSAVLWARDKESGERGAPHHEEAGIQAGEPSQAFKGDEGQGIRQAG